MIPDPALAARNHAFIPAVPQSDVCKCGIPAEPHHPLHERTEDEE